MGIKNQIPICEGQNIAETIYEQLKTTSPEPWSIFGVLGIKTCVKSKDSLTLKLAGVQKINTVVITYNQETDLYDISYHNCRILNREPWVENEKITETKGIDWESMAEVIIRTVRK
jgi:hypothetical protein